jgi:hypothetical protein
MAQTKQIAVSGNAAWSASNIPDWTSFDKTSGTAGNDTINVTAQDNVGDARSDNVLFTYGDGQTVSYPISQEAYSPPAPTTYSYALYNDGGTYTGGTAAGSYAAGTTMQAPTSAVRAGYTLANFQYSYMSGGSPSYVAVHLGQTFTMPASNITLQAIWNEIPTPSSATVTLTNYAGANALVALFRGGDAPIGSPGQYETFFLHPGEEWDIEWNGADDFPVNTPNATGIIYLGVGQTVWTWTWNNVSWDSNTIFDLSADGNEVIIQ